jgi:uncharacterized protein YeaO (DUF488 family)
MEMFRVKRVYEEAASGDGARCLVDRLWPRGVAKVSLRIDGWLKEAAPGDTLRRWFNHDPARWHEFRRRYFAELDAKPEAWAPLLDAAKKGPVTLVYSAHDEEHNNAVALAEYLSTHAAGRTRKGRRQ